MEKFVLKNMGCKSNQLEGSLIEENLLKNGFQKAENITDADFFILNACTVTHKSDNEAFLILRQAKKQKPSVKTVLTGCLAQIEKENLLKKSDIDIVLGNDEKLEISKYLQNAKSFVSKIDDLRTFHKILLQDTEKTRANLKIQDGCDNRCSYCIIPFARGKNRSADLDFILEQIKLYEKAGFKEIVLTGIHIGQWGQEENYKWKMVNGTVSLCETEDNTSIIQTSKPHNLLHLLQNIEEKTNIPRYRLGSLNPLEINDEMLSFLKTSEKFCPHFHLSLQSMCDKTLKSMNRFYTAQQSLELIDKISESFERPFIGSDVIAGFAGETEDDFEITVENLKKSKLTKIHTFPYSIRLGTLAETFPNQVDEKLKTERASIIKNISIQKYNSFLQSNLNETLEVLIEKHPDKKNGLCKGVSRNYIKVLIKNTKFSENLANSIHKVKIEGIEGDVFGEIL